MLEAVRAARPKFTVPEKWPVTTNVVAGVERHSGSVVRARVAESLGPDVPSRAAGQLREEGVVAAELVSALPPKLIEPWNLPVNATSPASSTAIPVA